MEGMPKTALAQCLEFSLEERAIDSASASNTEYSQPLQQRCQGAKLYERRMLATWPEQGVERCSPRRADLHQSVMMSPTFHLDRVTVGATKWKPRRWHARVAIPRRAKQVAAHTYLVVKKITKGFFISTLPFALVLRWLPIAIALYTVRDRHLYSALCRPMAHPSTIVSDFDVSCVRLWARPPKSYVHPLALQECRRGRMALHVWATGARWIHDSS